MKKPTLHLRGICLFFLLFLNSFHSFCQDNFRVSKAAAPVANNNSNGILFAARFRNSLALAEAFNNQPHLYFPIQDNAGVAVRGAEIHAYQNSSYLSRANH